MILPICSSALAEIAPTCAISFEVVVGFDSFFTSSTTALTALSTPRLRSIAFMPAATNFMPSRTIAWASTVAVVVPSPATSEVLDATSLTICAPMFWNLSLSSTSFATDTPSLVTVGEPNERSSTTLRPLGPRVAFTALARMFTPSSILCRASSWKRTSFAAIDWAPNCGGSSGDDAHDVFLAHHEVFGAFDLHGGAGVLAEQDPVADLDVEGFALAVIVPLARADGDDLALVRFLGGVVGDDDPAGALAFLF